MIRRRDSNTTNQHDYVPLASISLVPYFPLNRVARRGAVGTGAMTGTASAEAGTSDSFKSPRTTLTGPSDSASDTNGT